MIAQRSITPQTALVKLQELCARSEQCSNEILSKLKKWGIAGDVAGKILALLKRDRYVDDSRYAMAFVRDKVVFNRWGRIKIRLAMIQKRLPDDLIRDALGSIDPEEYHTALVEVLAAKARTLPEVQSYESRTKLLRYAASRGFETSLIVKIIKQPSLWTA
ncbi:MAG: RecX family transcriptional regulator [Clostridiales bacterium]|nr:RecX family transcriptional regulator [Clostridiales bacterium]